MMNLGMEVDFLWIEVLLLLEISFGNQTTYEQLTPLAMYLVILIRSHR
jgi:hypothetical protein